jgi:aminomethyltransferase
MAENLKKTPLHKEHLALGGKMIPFAGFEMPVQYPAGVITEHRQVREQAGLFDVSHMGEFLVKGEGAEGFVNFVVTNDVSTRVSGQAQYNAMCLDSGGIVDDLLVYKFAEDHFKLVVNAANLDGDFEWIQGLLKEYGASGIELVDESDQIGLLALQGPAAESIMDPLTDLDASAMKYYHFAEGQVVGEPCVVSRTGYTGEDGFEIYCDTGSAVKLWRAILEEGGDRVLPIGLGARDSLRLESGLALYGNDIDRETTPLEAGLGWIVKLQKGQFKGRDALASQKEAGLERKLCGFVLKERGFPRPGCEIVIGGQTAGTVRSGMVGPTVEQGIGTGYFPLEHSAPETPIEIMIRNRALPAEVVKMPFYKDGSVKR